MTSKVETSDKEGEKSPSSSGPVTGIEEKAKMFRQLHDDFGNSKLLSVITFENTSHYLIDGIGIEAN